MKLKVIKIGGKVIENDTDCNYFLNEFSKIAAPKILVHGGGNIATKLAEKSGVEVKMVDGRRITDAAMLEIVTMVYAGVNKKLVAQLQERGIQSIGLTGADLNVIKATKRKVATIDFGFVGDIDENGVDVEHINYFLSNKITPVFAALTHDGEGNLLNTNADTIAAASAMACAGKYDVELIYCFDKSGVLLDEDDDDSVIPEILMKELQKLKDEEVITAGMIPKLDNAFDAIKKGVKKVRITNFKDLAGGTVLRI